MKIICALLIGISLAGVTDADELQHHDVTVYGQKIHYAEAGNGRALILLHGLWGGLNEWEPIIGPLSQSQRVIVLDFLGFHASAKPDTRYHNALLAQYLAGFIATLELSDVILMGHAMGANAATYSAVHHPENLSALILIDGAGYRNPERDLTAPLSGQMLKFRRIATGSTLATTRGLLERRVLDPSLVTDAWVQEAFGLWVNSARAIGDMLLEGGDLTEEEMRAISLPTLVIWGADDKVFAPENALRLQADIKGTIVRTIDASGHLPQIEQTESFLAHVIPFLDSLRKP